MSESGDCEFQGWKVGDRFWTPWYGTGAIVSLRRSPATPIPHAQARLVPDTGISIWVWLEGAIKLAADEPDRPSEGLQSATVGQRVWHRHDGRGTVFEVKPLAGGRQAARIGFERGEGLLRWLVLGSEALRETEPALKPLPPPDPPSVRALVRRRRVWLLDDTFEPMPLRLPVLAENERAAWIKTVAARRATHLRAVAGRLLARSDQAAPIRCELLAPLFRSEGLTPCLMARYRRPGAWLPRRPVERSAAGADRQDRSADCYPDDTWCRITLETLAPFHRVDAWVKRRLRSGRALLAADPLLARCE